MSLKAHLVFQEGKSNKFWTATVEGDTFTVHYGRIGTEGQTVEKKFASEAEATKAFEKKRAEKLKEGYRDGAAGPEPVPGANGTRPYVHGNLAGFKVKQYEPKLKLGDLNATAYKFVIDYDEGEAGAKLCDRLISYLSDPASRESQALVIGAWEDCAGGTNSAPIVHLLTSASGKLSKLRAIYFGDIEMEESEISWIAQSNMATLFDAYPKLEHFLVRGGNGLALSFGTLKHAALKSLVIETGGLPAEVVREVCAAELPELEYLELWLGSDNYGGDATVADLKELLSGTRFPKLKYLGLRNSEFSDDISKAVVSSPLYQRIEVLDLSMGSLGDDGAQALLDAPATKKLKKLDLHWHYLSHEMMGKLRALGIRVDVTEVQEADDPDDSSSRYIQVSE